MEAMPIRGQGSGTALEVGASAGGSGRGTAACRDGRATAHPGRRAALAAAAATLAASLGSTLTGCGFHLRRTTDMTFTTLYSGFPRGSAVGEEFRREFARSTSTRLVEQPDKAQVVLLIMNESRERDIVAYSAVGRPREYELRLRLQFRATDGGDREFIGPSQIILRRDISAADNQLTARTDEEALLFRDMQKDMVQQLLRRLASIRISP